MLAGIALLAALLQPSPLSLRFEASYLQPTNDAVARGLGGGFGASYRLTDQISVVASAAQNVVWTQNGQPAGAPRGSRSLSLFSAGAQAVLDATPIAPFLEATLVDLAPKAVAGYAIAARIGFGADWAFLPAWALGLAIRSFSPLDTPGGITALGGAEIAARLVWTPAF
ncbi:MAG: hypothetical protein E6J62_11025 [Deltaproteobacteria bacterium]|nr:MAG: hypothetical protein E6J85_03490 [Deltaproteobacteria bacterium]TMB29645.1 MAG: hypothetical protein E6J61_14735 [Deltaproteobacteria bacterium]TMB33559.1 MAG: hypothetical protein E6J62_11025 [Deltaproteobacteria bacterium]